MSTMSLQDRHRLANVIGEAQRLDGLDNVWTSHLGQPTATVTKDAATLANLVASMKSLLQTIEGEADFLQSIAIDTATLAKNIAAANVSAADRKAFDAVIARYGSVEAAAKGHFGEIKQQFASERSMLDHKIGLVQSGQHTPGDLSRKAKCIIGILCLFAEEAPPVVAVGIGLIAANCGSDDTSK